MFLYIIVNPKKSNVKETTFFISCDVIKCICAKKKDVTSYLKMEMYLIIEMIFNFYEIFNIY